eukprot:12427672-Karenia_brevis.AAC.1
MACHLTWPGDWHSPLRWPMTAKAATTECLMSKCLTVYRQGATKELYITQKLISATRQEV